MVLYIDVSAVALGGIHMDQFMGPYRGGDIDTIIRNMSQRPHIAALKKDIRYLVVDDGCP